MSASRYFLPGLGGAAVSTAVRLVFANVQVALIGLVVFFVVYGALILLGRGMNWPEQPVRDAIVATIATTAAYVLTDHQA
ncbi:hypothetical protein [Aurantiacibacter poecillastricola]|uniref:hypothetical protein n=1 Tax=Aurantiacibacter poecillastricola TaxID=3064385 RepID=UPI00273FC16E|nr:hypothetical protein [Aurantiacibacter sp. 219JJ12-13]MDP5263475.1 hypothetical protein [Aurantiacibacter sp. 219JJ12-13]